MSAQNEGYELGWESTIEKDNDFVLLPAGDYDFEVMTYERARHGGSDKIPPCNKAIVHIKVSSPEGSTTIKHQLLLYSSLEWKLCEFFTAIGKRKKGEKLKMDFNGAIGCKGRCKVGTRKWLSNNGQEMEGNQIETFYEPDEAVAAPTFQQGRF